MVVVLGDELRDKWYLQILVKYGESGVMLGEGNQGSRPCDYDATKHKHGRELSTAGK